jgi:hypothetical protein
MYIDNINISSATSLSENEIVGLNVYPNPASYNLWVGVPVQSGKAILNIFNAQGQLVHTENLNAGMNQVSLPSLAVGTYVCKVSNDTNLWTKTIIIK